MPSLRPSEFNRIARSREEGEPFLELQGAEDEGVDVYFVQMVPDTLLAPVSPGNPALKRRKRILNVCPDVLTMWPINVRPDKRDYLQPKYETLDSIILTRRETGAYEMPESEEGVTDLLEGLPEGFHKQFQFGLGLHWENRFICESIAAIPGIQQLCIHGGNRDAKIDPPLFILGLQRFHEIRRHLAVISARYQREARTDKLIYSHNSLLSVADRQRFPQKAKQLRPNSIADLADTSGARTSLSKRDQRTALRLVDENADELARLEPRELLRLKIDIERVSLKELIASFEEMLASDLKEQKWQAFFNANPFVLSMAFSAPALMVNDNAYVGGARFERSGGKIADFLLATASSGNLAIVEIKTPKSALVRKTSYRDDVFATSAELGGAVAQVLDQRFRLQNHFLTLKEESGRTDLHAYAIQCIIIVGKTPDSPAERKSLELFRNSLSNVTIVTFDELLGRLKEIYDALAKVAQDRSSSTHESPF